MKKQNYWISLVVIAFACWLFFATKDFPKYYKSAPGPGFWPRVIAIVMIICAVLLVVTTFISSKKSTEASKEKPIVSYRTKGLLRVYRIFGLMFLSLLSIYFLGYIITSLWFVPAIIIVMEERRPWVLAVSSIALTVSIHLIFNVAFQITLPQGILI